MKTAYDILQSHHDFLIKDKNGVLDKPSEYIEERILLAMEEYANQFKQEKVKRKTVKVNIPQPQIPIQDKTPLSQTFDKWVDMRKKMKGGITDYAIELGKNELRKLSGGDANKAIEIINQSILNSWKGFFPLKKFNNATSQKRNELDELLNQSLATLQGD